MMLPNWSPPNVLHETAHAASAIACGIGLITPHHNRRPRRLGSPIEKDSFVQTWRVTNWWKVLRLGLRGHSDDTGTPLHEQRMQLS